MTPKFLADIQAFNKMYGQPTAAYPTTALQPVGPRMALFQPILLKEWSEGADIENAANAGAPEIDVLVDMADWLCDLMVYCASEAARYGIPVMEVLEIIMQSNFSKLGEDGQPIVKDGKIQKGPNYWKPEPKIRELLLAHQLKGTNG